MRPDKNQNSTLNAMSVDMEEWFCVTNFEDAIQRRDWASLESRVEPQTDKILDLFRRYEIKSTFFVLGWIAERHPALIERIARAGHELAAHGHEHLLVDRLTPEQFREDLTRSLSAIKQITGIDCEGYRAPSFSLRREMDWAWRILVEAGIRYDSSVFPIRHDRYGEPTAPRFPYRLPEGMIEFPPSTVSVLGRNVPVAGGGYFRLYPLPVTRWAIRRINRSGYPAVVYLHPWEFDPEHPRPRVPRLTLWRHRCGIRTVTRKLESLLREFRFGPMKEALAATRIADSPGERTERPADS